MKQLVELDLSFSKVSTLDLTGLESLRKLSLRETMISDETVAAFPPLPELSNLDISCMPGRNPRVTDKGIRAITKENFPKLKTLYIYDCGISDREISRLKAEFPMLKIIR
jgi:Leucine-rich repeat (LRR) protein